LAQVYGFAQQSGGRVEIDTALGRGTTVTLMLPQALELPATRSTGASAVAEDGTSDARVLLVEDDPAVASMVAASLRELGYDVARAANADEALPLLDGGERVDVLVSDVVMPGRLSGVDLVREVQRLRPDLPVILATGYSEDAARAVGVRILLKPFPISALVEAVESALAQSRARPRVRV
jgi:CheY-like chemotaxis protein